MQDRGLLISISNNRADQEYMRLGAGINSEYGPYSIELDSLYQTSIHSITSPSASIRNAMTHVGKTRAATALQQLIAFTLPESSRLLLNFNISAGLGHRRVCQLRAV